MSKLLNNLKKDEYILKKNNNKINMVSKKVIADFKKNPKDYLEKLNDNELIDFVQDLNYEYYIKGVSLVNDELYDYTKDELRKRKPEHPLLKDVGVSKTSKIVLPSINGKYITEWSPTTRGLGSVLFFEEKASKLLLRYVVQVLP